MYAYWNRKEPGENITTKTLQLESSSVSFKLLLSAPEVAKSRTCYPERVHVAEEPSHDME